MARIASLRRSNKWPATRIALELNNSGVDISRRTVTRHLYRLGLNRRRFIDPTGALNRAPRTIVARRPGHMVHVDVKKVGRIPDGGGWRVHGKGSVQAKAVDRTKKRGTTTGYTYLHSAVDGYSRLAYTEALTDEKAVTAIGFMFRARAFFAAHGIVRIERIVTDNGACYRAHDFAKVLLGARHQRITPYTPPTTAKPSATTGSLPRNSSTPANGTPNTNDHTPSSQAADGSERGDQTIGESTHSGRQIGSSRTTSLAKNHICWSGHRTSGLAVLSTDTLASVRLTSRFVVRDGYL